VTATEDGRHRPVGMIVGHTFPDPAKIALPKERQYVDITTINNVARTTVALSPHIPIAWWCRMIVDIFHQCTELPLNPPVPAIGCTKSRPFQ